MFGKLKCGSTQPSLLVKYYCKSIEYEVRLLQGSCTASYISYQFVSCHANQWALLLVLLNLSIQGLVIFLYYQFGINCQEEPIRPWGCNGIQWALIWLDSKLRRLRKNSFSSDGAQEVLNSVRSSVRPSHYFEFFAMKGINGARRCLKVPEGSRGFQKVQGGSMRFKRFKEVQ